jgi:hypothetical protein
MGAGQLTLYRKLSPAQKHRLLEVVSRGKVREEDLGRETSLTVKRLLSHYIDADGHGEGG